MCSGVESQQDGYTGAGDTPQQTEDRCLTGRRQETHKVLMTPE